MQSVGLIVGSGTCDSSGIMNMIFSIPVAPEVGPLEGTGSIDCNGVFLFEVPSANLLVEGLFLSDGTVSGTWTNGTSLSGVFSGSK